MSERTTIGNILDRVSQNRRYNWFGLIVALALLMGCLLFLLPAALSGNWLFPVNYIRAKPIQAAVYYRGEAEIYTPGSSEYDRLIEACYETLYNHVGIAELGWSEGRFDQARIEGVAIELLYAEPVKLPGRRLDIADPVRLFFPLELFGFDSEVVFRGDPDHYWGLPIQVDTLDRVRTVVEEIMGE
ncbi:MAG: hypothetical protein JXB30_03225 [Anaerolineae bacterium]|nr:hypothetical protein [Anaerolineae bacterium]